MMNIWEKALEIFVFGFSSVFFVLGVLSISVVLTRTAVARMDARDKQKKAAKRQN